jgi:hypothetical protein
MPLSVGDKLGPYQIFTPVGPLDIALKLPVGGNHEVGGGRWFRQTRLVDDLDLLHLKVSMAGSSRWGSEGGRKQD